MGSRFEILAMAYNMSGDTSNLGVKVFPLPSEGNWWENSSKMTYRTRKLFGLFDRSTIR